MTKHHLPIRSVESGRLVGFLDIDDDADLAKVRREFEAMSSIDIQVEWPKDTGLKFKTAKKFYKAMNAMVENGYQIAFIHTDNDLEAATLVNDAGEERPLVFFFNHKDFEESIHESGE